MGAAQAKNNLAASVRTAKAVFGKVARNEAAAARRSAASRASIARKLRSSTKAAKRSLRDAVSGLNRSMLALKSETAKKIKKTNRGIDAYANKMARNARAVQAAMKANVASLTSKIDAARKSASAAIRGANAASAARQVTVLTTLKSAMAKAQRRANRKFGKAYRKLAKDRAHADTSLASATNAMNDSLAKQAALADARFSHTVRNIAAARAQCRRQVAAARKSFTTAIVRVTSEVKDQETRLSGEIAVVSGEVVSNRAAQMRVNRRTGAELKRITKLANMQARNNARNRRNSRRIASYSARARAELFQAKKAFGARLSTLTNTVTANNRKTESLLAGLTGLVRDKKAASAKDRALIKAQTSAMNADLNKKIVRSIQMGEARAKRAERTGDKLFKMIQGNHKKIADNYLSLKAYAATCSDKLKEYVAKGKGRNLSSLGDL